MPLFDGLSLPEWILLVAGCVFFLVLLILFMRLALAGKDYKNLLFFFAFPILMIGFTGIRSFEISQDSLSIVRNTDALRTDPNDQTARTSLESTVTKLSGRTFTNPQTLAHLANAQYALGDEKAAKENLGKALSAAPTLQPALDLKNRMESANRVAELAKAAEAPNASPEVKRNLQVAVQQASQYQYANLKALQTMQKATHILRADEVKPVAVPK